MKAHLLAVEHKVTDWPPSVKALCGAEVKNPRPVLDFDLESRELTVLNTILVCPTCWVLSAQVFEVAKYLYGVLPAEAAHRANLGKQTED